MDEVSSPTNADRNIKMADDDDANQKIILISEDGCRFTTSVKVMNLSKLVEESLGEDPESLGSDVEIPLPKVKGIVLEKVIEYCDHYTNKDPMKEIKTPLPKSNKIEDAVQSWYCEYSDVDDVMKYEILAAANFMNIQPLLDLMCLRISVYIFRRKAEDIKKIFNIPENPTPEETQEILEENRWAMQGQQQQGDGAENDESNS